MRGTLDCVFIISERVGIIPAYAGNTLRKMKRTVRARDHPRVCGEHLNPDRWLSYRKGSSPRMRGTLGEGRRGIAEGRIIPAYAGNTPRFPIGRGAMWDHPRVCGEHGRFLLDLRLLQGSSPRMRGTH